MGRNNNKLKGFFVLLSISIVSFIGCNSDKLPMKKINAYTETKANTWENSEEISSGESIVFELSVLNNPYKFSPKEKLLVYINEELIYKGNFTERVKVKMPSKYLGKRVIPTLQILKGNETHNFIHKVSTYVSQHDQFAYVVFCPENDLTESCYLFFQEEEIL